MIEFLSIKNLRIIEALELRPAGGLNVVSGANGAGKTTLLEAVYLLARGKSFRHREVAPLVREGARELEVVGRFCGKEGAGHVLGTRRSRGETVVRLDGRAGVRRSEIMGLLPIQLIGADAGQLVTGEPRLRRSFIDAGLFHVEQSYLEVLQRYQRTLDQRNKALRAKQPGFYHWDEQLVRYGLDIDSARKRYLEGLEERIQSWLERWRLGLSVSFYYRQGWVQDEGLGEALERLRDTDSVQHFTSCGPHRADWVISGSHARSGKTLSRGQLKMLVTACYLAQADILRERGRQIPVLLFDDLPSELDKINRERLLHSILETYPQALVTALAAEDLPLEATRLFHVEQGSLVP